MHCPTHIHHIKEVPQHKLPKTRPVVSNNRRMGVHLANTVSNIVESLANSMDSTFESISNEYVLARIDE